MLRCRHFRKSPRTPARETLLGKCRHLDTLNIRNGKRAKNHRRENQRNLAENRAARPRLNIRRINRPAPVGHRVARCAVLPTFSLGCADLKKSSATIRHDPPKWRDLGKGGHVAGTSPAFSRALTACAPFNRRSKKKMSITTHDVVRLAARAVCDTRTVERCYRGGKTHMNTRLRLEQAARELGLSLPPVPSAPSAVTLNLAASRNVPSIT